MSRRTEDEARQALIRTLGAECEANPHLDMVRDYGEDLANAYGWEEWAELSLRQRHEARGWFNAGRKDEQRVRGD